MKTTDELSSFVEEIKLGFRKIDLSFPSTVTYLKFRTGEVWFCPWLQKHPSNLGLTFVDSSSVGTSWSRFSQLKHSVKKNNQWILVSVGSLSYRLYYFDYLISGEQEKNNADILRGLVD